MTDKAPAVESWKPYTVSAAPLETVVQWFTDNGTPASPGMAIVCGKVSGNLTVMDFDAATGGAMLYDEWRDLVEVLCPGLTEELPLVSSPSGGCHVYFRSDEVKGNTRLAENAQREVLIETRGEGGYIIAPPSPGYTLVSGLLSNIPYLSQAERDVLLHAAQSLTALPSLSQIKQGPQEALPGDAYNARTSLADLEGLLGRHGWTRVRGTSGAGQWRRPGKEGGVSATLRLVGNMPLFYCFSTNVPSIPAGQSISPFGLYTMLEHGGDYKAASRTLAAEAKLAVRPGSAATAPAAPAAPYDWEQGIFNGNDLLKMVFAPIEWVVPQVFPQGLTLLAGSPKSGKSLLSLGLAVAAATGGTALGNVQVEQRPVLYLLLEDGKRLCQARLAKIAREGADLSKLFIKQDWRGLVAGGVEDIVSFFERHPKGLVVLDTYESLRGQAQDRGDAYRNDYAALKPLHDAIKDQPWSVILVHHTNKHNSEDPVLAINGSNGIAGNVDTLGLLRWHQDGEEVMLTVRGRDLDAQKKYLLSFDAASGTHTLLGDDMEVGKNRQQQAIIDFLRGQGVEASPKEIARAVGRESDKALLMQLGRMVQSGVIVKSDWGRYTLRGNGKDGNTYVPANRKQDGGVNPTSPVGNECVTPVGSVTADPPEPPRVGAVQSFRGVEARFQTPKCAGCGKMWTKRHDAEAVGGLVCVHCGTTSTAE